MSEWDEKMWEPLYPKTKFAVGRVPIATCRQCLWKSLCLEEEKNPTLRKLILDEDEQQDHADSMKDCAK